MIEIIKNYLRKDDHIDYTDHELNKEFTTLVFTLLATFMIGLFSEIVLHKTIGEGLIIIGILIYIFLRYKQRGPWYD